MNIYEIQNLLMESLWNLKHRQYEFAKININGAIQELDLLCGKPIEN